MKYSKHGSPLITFIDKQFARYLRCGHKTATLAMFNLKTVFQSRKTKANGNSKMIEVINYCIYDCQRTLERLETNTVDKDIKAIRKKDLMDYIEIYKEVKELFRKEFNMDN